MLTTATREEREYWVHNIHGHWECKKEVHKANQIGLQAIQGIDYSSVVYSHTHIAVECNDPKPYCV